MVMDISKKKACEMNLKIDENYYNQFLNVS